MDIQCRYLESWHGGKGSGLGNCYSHNATDPYSIIQLWELLQDTSLLDGLGPESDKYSREAHFAQMISLLGPPPQELLDRADSAVLSSLYTTQGMYDSEEC